MSRLFNKPWMRLIFILGITLSVIMILAGSISATTSPPGKAEGQEAVVMPFADYTLIPPTENISTPPPFTSDIMTIDQQAQLLYVTDNILRGIDVFDVSTSPATYLHTIYNYHDLNGNGVELAKNVNKLFVGLGNGPPFPPFPDTESYVEVIDINTQTVIGEVNTGTVTETDSTSPLYGKLIGPGKTDELAWDPVDRKLYAANATDGFVTVVSATTNSFSLVKQITGLSSSLEQPRYNPDDKMMYLNGSSANVMFQFDPSNDTLKNTFSLPSDLGPTGLAINPETNQALLGGNYLALWDFKTETVVKKITEWGGADATAYDPAADVYLAPYFLAKPGPLVGILSGKGANLLSIVQSVLGAHTLAFNESTNMIYVFDQNTISFIPGAPYTGSYILGFPIPQALHGRSSTAPNNN